MIDDLKTVNDLEESSSGLIEVASQQLPGRTGENHEKPVTMGGVPSEIPTEHLLNRSLERYF
jgi:hypothetical protein